MPAALAFRYARALAAQPGAAADPEAVAREMEAFAGALAESELLRNALGSPAVPPPRKRAVVARLARTLPLSDLVRRFLLVLIDHRRMALVAQIREAFETVVDERRGVVRVEVLSARELAPQQRQEVLAELGRLTGRQPRASFSVRPELIGGVVARIGSTVYDGSVRGQLEALKKRLAGAGT